MTRVFQKDCSGHSLHAGSVSDCLGMTGLLSSVLAVHPPTYLCVCKKGKVRPIADHEGPERE